MEAIILVVVIGLSLLCVLSMWILFEKAGKAGWASIVPIYNIIVFLDIIEKPWWWLLLMLIPFLGLIWIIWSVNLFTSRFGDKGIGGTISFLLFPVIYIPMLAFDKGAVFRSNTQ